MVNLKNTHSPMAADSAILEANVNDEINRLASAKLALKSSIMNKGVSIPAGAHIDEYATYVNQISQSGGGNEPPLTPLFQGALQLMGTNGIAVPVTSWSTPLLIAGHAESHGIRDNWLFPINFIVYVTNYIDGEYCGIYDFPPVWPAVELRLNMTTDYTDEGFENIYFSGSCLNEATVYITGIYKAEVPVSQQLAY